MGKPEVVYSCKPREGTPLGFLFGPRKPVRCHRAGFFAANEAPRMRQPRPPGRGRVEHDRLPAPPVAAVSWSSGSHGDTRSSPSPRTRQSDSDGPRGVRGRREGLDGPLLISRWLTGARSSPFAAQLPATCGQGPGISPPCPGPIPQQSGGTDVPRVGVWGEHEAHRDAMLPRGTASCYGGPGAMQGP